MKILLVEDSETLRLSNERALVEAGHDVTCADDCDSALQTARDQSPDLILLDLMAPKSSELEVVTRLKHSRTTAKIPVIALSALPERSVTSCSTRAWKIMWINARLSGRGE